MRLVLDVFDTATPNPEIDHANDQSHRAINVSLPLVYSQIIISLKKFGCEIIQCSNQVRFLITLVPTCLSVRVSSHDKHKLSWTAAIYIIPYPL